MSIRKTKKYLLLRYQQQVAVVELEHGKMKIIHFGGEVFTEFDGSFWKTMIRYANYESGQQADLCLIASDDCWDVPDEFCNAQVSEKTAWDIMTISQAIELIKPDFSFHINASGGRLLHTHHALFPTTEPVDLTAVFAGSDHYTNAETPVSENKPIKKTKAIHDADLTGIMGLTDEEYEQSSPLCKHFVDLNREAEKRGQY